MQHRWHARSTRKAVCSDMNTLQAQVSYESTPEARKSNNESTLSGSTNFSVSVCVFMFGSFCVGADVYAGKGWIACTSFEAPTSTLQPIKRVSVTKRVWARSSSGVQRRQLHQNNFCSVDYNFCANDCTTLRNPAPVPIFVDLNSIV